MDAAGWAWAIPALSAIAFFIVLPFRRRLPMQGAPISIGAILLGFALFWVVLARFLAEGGGGASVRMAERRRHDYQLGRLRRPNLRHAAGAGHVRRSARASLLAWLHEASRRARPGIRAVFRLPLSVRGCDAVADSCGQSAVPLYRVGAGRHRLVSAYRVLVRAAFSGGGG